MGTIDRAHLEFRYASRMHATSEWRLLEMWDVIATHTTYKGNEATAEPVASAHFVVVDFDRLGMAAEEPTGYGDYYSQELGLAMELLVDSAGPRDRTLRLTQGDWPVIVLFMDRVHVVRRYRGQHLGRLIAAEAIATLGRGCRFVLTYPAPTESAAAAGTDEHNAQRRALRRYWAGIGFRSYVDGFSVLDLYGGNHQLDRHLLRWDTPPSKHLYA